MRQILSMAIGAVLAIALAGCASTSTSNAPCASCKWSAKNSQGPAGDPKLGCVVDGKTVDCKKTPPECPECAKAVQR
jgi:uncharacterized lipoprotein YbaY